MAGKFHAQIVAREGTRYEGQCEYVRLPGQDGYFGVMADHAPLIAALVPGKIVVSEGPERSPLFFACSTGVAEVRSNKVVVLVDAAESAEEVDVARARAAADRARARLSSRRDRNYDRARAEAALARATARLHVADEIGMTVSP